MLNDQFELECTGEYFVPRKSGKCIEGDHLLGTASRLATSGISPPSASLLESGTRPRAIRRAGVIISG